jgi:hypothetical protein
MAEIRTLIEPSHLYRYRSLEDQKLNQEISAIQERYLWCSNFEAMNDPMEGTYEATAIPFNTSLHRSLMFSQSSIPQAV